ncbi:MAG: PKD domain-containing protein [Opitutaceae bacterium]|nr:PKD domain-containing protein [Opitutaceae bacterium]
MHKSSVRLVLATLAAAAALLFAFRYLSVPTESVRTSEAPRPASASATVAAGVPAPSQPNPVPPAANAEAVRAAGIARDDAVAKLIAFDKWLSDWRRASDPGSALLIAAGRDLAVARRAALKFLIEIDPREALAHAVSRRDRNQLPAEITAALEQPIDAFADFELIAICDERGNHYDRWSVIGGRRYATYTFGRRLETISKNRLPIHGIAVDDRLAMADEPCRALDDDELALRRDGSEAVQVAVGDTVQSFASAAELAAWIDRTIEAETRIDPVPSNPATAAAPAGWTVGEKTVLWIRAEFPDDPGSPVTNDEINSAMGFVDAYYKDNSHGTCWFKPTIVPGTVMLNTTKAIYGATSDGYVTLRNDALQLARNYDAANGGTGQYNPDRYERHVVIFKKISAYSWAGIASVGAKGLCLNGNITGCVSAHELGHNHGLRHSHGWLPAAGSATGAGTHLEYGDAFDDMGSAQAGNSGGHFNAVQKFNLGYLASEAITTVTKTGVYRIFRHDDRNAEGVQALKIATSNVGTNYWFEYRRAEPYNGFAYTSGQPQLPRLQNGLVVHWDRGPTFANGPGTYLLDMTPGTTSGVSPPTDTGRITHVLNDAALAFGESFTDGATELTVTPFNAGGTAPNEWIDVFISLGPVTTNRAPTVAASAPAGVLSARTEIALTATGADPDGDTVYYRWDFGDQTIAPATASVTHRWLKGGTYAVRCTALDGRGGQTTTSFNITVTDPLLTWTRRAEGLTTNWFYDVVFGGGKFVAVGSYVAATSTDGATWTRAQGLNNSYNYAVAYGSSLYVAVGYRLNGTGQPNSTGIMTSADGLTWQNRSPAESSPDLKSICYAAGRFVAVGKSGIIFSSTDGATWTAASSGTTNDLNAVRYGGGRFVAAGVAATYLTSADGVTWQNVSPAGEASTAYGLVHYQGSWLAVTGSSLVADSTKRVAFTSPDGQRWTKVYIDAGVSFTSSIIPVANSSLLLAVSRANAGQIFLSESPLHWESAPVFPASAAGTSTNLQAAAEGNGTIVVVGLSSQIYTPAGAPILAGQPIAQTVTAGSPVTLSAGAYASGPFTYQWYRNGGAITGATGATLAIPSASSSDAGSYTVVVTNAAGSVTTTAAQITVTGAAPVANVGRLTNLSIRSQAGTGAETLIVGVTVGGAGTIGQKPVLVRAIGPTLARFGVADAIADPVLTVFQDGAITGSNDNWSGDTQVSNAGTTLGAFPFDSPTSKDAGLYRQLNAGGYSIQITGNGGTGIALAEIYDATPGTSFTTTTPRLVNVSARSQVGTGGNILIAGFVVGGSTSKNVLIRAIGPTLAGFGVSGAIVDPKLELFRSDTAAAIATSDNWGSAANASQVAAAAASVGAFPLATDTKDAVLLFSLPPGTYTAQVSGVNGTIGVALVELYELP